MEEFHSHSRRPGTGSSRIATPKEKEDFSPPEPTSKIQEEDTNKPKLGHMAAAESVAMARGWEATIGQALVTWHSLVPPQGPDVVKEEPSLKEGSVLFP